MIDYSDLPAAVRREIAQVAAAVGRAVARLLRLFLLLVTRLRPRRDAEPTTTSPEVGGEESEPDMEAVYEILSRRYDTGETDVAARHNELEP